MVDVGPPLKPSVLNLTPEESESFEGMIAQGLLPHDWFDRCDAARTANVFGQDFKTDRKGNPVEMGIGSESQMTANSIAAYEKWGKDEVDFEKHLARMKKLFAEQQVARDAKHAAEQQERRDRIAKAARMAGTKASGR